VLNLSYSRVSWLCRLGPVLLTRTRELLVLDTMVCPGAALTTACLGASLNRMSKSCLKMDILVISVVHRLENKYMYVCHAEMNAILNKNSESVRDCTIYVALFPCNECAKIIIQSGIKNVIYFSDKHKDKNSTIASKRLLDMAGVPYTQFIPKMKKIVIDFDSVDPTDVKVMAVEKED